ncbi:peptidyl-prolyl cis-trans isomerase [Sphingomonas sp. 1P06PA]|uniref:peptidylprolyl isomerase n=1 Tax=Sphingomonas sp. 1P06PA TaxID=554121 RepID=UPI0039A63F2B
MLSFFRRGLSSWFVIALLAVVAGAVVITGVNGPSGPGGTTVGSGETVAQMKGLTIGADEVTKRAQRTVELSREQSPEADMAGFVAQGGVEQTVQQLIAGRALELWAREQGFTASDRLVDGEIASIAAFRGPTGAFDRQAMTAVLAQQRVSEKQLREDISGDIVRRQLLGPIAGGARAATGIVTPYAALLLERRQGMIGFVPAARMAAGPPPTAAEVQAFYTKNIAGFTLPERRAARYALFGPQNVASPAPTEAEVAAFYKANAATFAGSETRTLSQVVLPDEAAARALSARVKGGTSFAAAAQAAGFAPSDTALGPQSRTQFADLATPAAADAVFALPSGATSDPLRSPLGWHVVRVDSITRSAGRTLDQARAEIAQSLGRQKAEEGLADLVAKIEDSVGDGATFDEVVKANGLTVVTVPPVTSAGAAPGVAGFRAPAELPPLLKPIFDMEVDADPLVELLGQGQPYALLDVTEILPSAPVPLAQVRDRAVQGVLAERAFNAARKVADTIVARANRGTPLPEAFRAAAPNLPAPQAAGGRQLELAQAGKQIPPPLAMMFAMRQGSTKLLPGPQGSGFFVVRLDRIEKGDVASQPGLVEMTRRQFATVLGEEYAQQFVGAIAKSLQATRDPAAIQRLKTTLVSGAAQ